MKLLAVLLIGILLFGCSSMEGGDPENQLISPERWRGITTSQIDDLSKKLSTLSDRLSKWHTAQIDDLSKQLSALSARLGRLASQTGEHAKALQNKLERLNLLVEELKRTGAPAESEDVRTINLVIDGSASLPDGRHYSSAGIQGPDGMVLQIRVESKDFSPVCSVVHSSDDPVQTYADDNGDGIVEFKIILKGVDKPVGIFVTTKEPGKTGKVVVKSWPAPADEDGSNDDSNSESY